MLLDQRVKKASLGQTATLRGTLPTTCLRALRAARGQPARAWQARSCSTCIHSSRLGQSGHVAPSFLPFRAMERRVAAHQASILAQWRTSTHDVAAQAYRSTVSGTASTSGGAAVQPTYLSPDGSFHDKDPASVIHMQPPGRELATPSSSTRGSTPPPALQGTNGSSSSSSSSTLQESGRTIAEILAEMNGSPPQQQQQQQHSKTVPVMLSRGRPPPNRPRPRQTGSVSGLNSTSSTLPQQQQQQPEALRPQPPPKALAATTAARALASTAEAADLALQSRFTVSVRGFVRTITHEADNGFKIIKVQVLEGSTDPSVGPAVLRAAASTLAAATVGKKKGGRASKAPLAVLGSLPGVKVGMELELQGDWEHNTIHGWQVKVSNYRELSSASTDPITYLQHLRGVGEATAKLIVEGLAGRDVSEVFDSDDAVDTLSSIKGIGPKMAARFKMSWDGSKGFNDVISWLQQHGVPVGAARGVAEAYKSDAKALATKNPYMFIDTVPGFRFHDAEHLAERLAVDPGAPERAAAALQHTLTEAASRDSETAMEWWRLQSKTLQFLGKFRPWPEGHTLHTGAELLVRNGKLVVEDVTLVHTPQQQHQQEYLYNMVAKQDSWNDNALVMLSVLHRAEEDIIDFLIKAAAACHRELKKLIPGFSSTSSSSSESKPAPPSCLGLLPIKPQLAEYITQCESELSAELGVPVQFNEGQRQAVAMVAALPVVLVTGGPGCGKTLTSQAIARGWLDQSLKVALAAPTGRAAQRLQEQVSPHESASDASASTIHRLLGYRGRKARATAAVEAATAAAQAKGVAYDPKVAAAAAAAFTGGPDDRFDPGHICQFDKHRPLDVERLLVDEVSMMDVGLAAALFNASRKSKLLLVGDPDQLPPVGPGRPLAAALAAGVLPCVDLRQIYRSAAGSAIVMAAHNINQGRMPDITTWDLHPDNIAADLAAHIAAVPQSALGKLQLPSNALMLRLPDKVGEVSVKDALLQAVQQLVPLLDCDPQRDVQVLCPRKHKSAIGVEALNQDLQMLLNPQDSRHQEMSVLQQPHRVADSRSADRMWRVGDRVIHLENDPDREVYNGDLGYIESVDPLYRKLTVRYPPRNRTSAFHIVQYEGREINDVVQLAWATTVHKAQGGEYPVVMMPLHASASQYLLRRPLLYTGVSRAKQLLVIVGTVSALQQCLRAGPTAAGCSALLQHQQHHHHKRSSSGWYDSVQGTRLYERLRAEAAAKNLQPLHRIVYGSDGWVQQ